MTIRGGGNPILDMACAPRFRMGPPPRSFAADAYDCIMVRIHTGSTEYKCVARWSRLDGELPSDCLAPSAGLSRNDKPDRLPDPPGKRGCNPIAAKIEICWSSLRLVPLLLYNSISGGRGLAMGQGVRVIGADRAQLRWEMVDLDSQLPDDHRARLVWAFVQALELGEFYDRIKARDEVAGRPATDPQVVPAVWLYPWRGSARRGQSIDCASSMPPIAGCAAGRRSIMICWRRSGARMRRHWIAC